MKSFSAILCILVAGYSSAALAEIGCVGKFNSEDVLLVKKEGTGKVAQYEATKAEYRYFVNLNKDQDLLSLEITDARNDYKSASTSSAVAVEYGKTARLDVFNKAANTRVKILCENK